MLNVLACLLSGALLSLAFPGANLQWIAWFALVPLFYSVYNSTWKNAFLCGLAFGCGFFLCHIYWMLIFGSLPWIALSVFQALFAAGFAAAGNALASRLGNWGKLAVIPALWVSFEWLRSLGMFGFTWGDLGYSQYKVLPVIQIASITGVWGVSFLLALSNSALALVFLDNRHSGHSRRALPQLAAALAVVFAAITFGVWSARTAGDFSGKKLRAAVIQGNVSQDTENSAAYADEAWRNYTAMTQKASKNGARLIVWPETAVPGFLGTDPYTQDRMKSLAESTRAALLVGGWDTKRDGRVLNTAFMITPFAGITGRSAKIHLVPFGEFVPARRFLPFLGYYRVRSCDTSPGDGYNVMSAGSSQIGTTVCFESAFPYVARQLVDQGAQVLCVITDDEWFGKSAAAEQHFAKSVLRAVENRRYVLRAAATGVSGIIGPDGKILDHAQSRSSALLERSITAREDKTFYTRHGDWVVWLSILIPFLLFVASGRLKRGTRL